MLRISSTYLASGNFLCTFCKRWRREGKQFQVMAFTQGLERRYITSCQNTIKWTMTRLPYMSDVKHASSVSYTSRIDHKCLNSKAGEEGVTQSKRDARSKAVTLLNYNVSQNTSERGDRKQIHSGKIESSLSLIQKKYQPRRTISKAAKALPEESLLKRNQRLIRQSEVQKLNTLEKLGKTVNVKTNNKAVGAGDRSDRTKSKLRPRSNSGKNGAVWDRVTADKADKAFVQFQEMLRVPESNRAEQFQREQDTRKKLKPKPIKKKTVNVFKVSDPHVKQRLQKNKINVEIYDQTRLLNKDEPQCEFAEVQCGRKKLYIAFLEDGTPENVADKITIKSAAPRSSAFPDKLMKMTPAKLSKITPEKIVKMIRDGKANGGKLVKMIHDKPPKGGPDKPRNGGRDRSLQVKIPRNNADLKVVLNLKKPQENMSCPTIHFKQKTSNGLVAKAMKLQIKKMEKYLFLTNNGKIRIRYLTGGLANIKQKLIEKVEIPKILRYPIAISTQGKILFYEKMDDSKLPVEEASRTLSEKPKESLVQKFKLLNVKQEDKSEINKETERKYLFRILKRKTRKVANEKVDDGQLIEAKLNNNVSETFSKFDTLLQGMDKPKEGLEKETKSEMKPDAGKKVPAEAPPPEAKMSLPKEGANVINKEQVIPEINILPKPKPKTVLPTWKEIEKISREKQEESSKVLPSQLIDPYFMQLQQQKFKQREIQEPTTNETEPVPVPNQLDPAYQGNFVPGNEEVQEWPQTDQGYQIPDGTSPSQKSQENIHQEAESLSPNQPDQPQTNQHSQQLQVSPAEWSSPDTVTHPTDHQTPPKSVNELEPSRMGNSPQSPQNDFYYPELRNQKSRRPSLPPPITDQGTTHFVTLLPEPEQSLAPNDIQVSSIFTDREVQMYDAQLEETINRPLVQDMKLKDPDIILREDLPDFLPENIINKWDDKNWDVRQNWETRADKVPNLRKLVRANSGNADYVHSFIIESDTLGECYRAFRQTPDFTPKTVAEYNFKYDQEPEMRMFENVVAQNFTRVDDPDFIQVKRLRNDRAKVESNLTNVTVIHPEVKTPPQVNTTPQYPNYPPTGLHTESQEITNSLQTSTEGDSYISGGQTTNQVLGNEVNADAKLMPLFQKNEPLEMNRNQVALPCTSEITEASEVIYPEQASQDQSPTLSFQSIGFRLGAIEKNFGTSASAENAPNPRLEGALSHNPIPEEDKEEIHYENIIKTVERQENEAQSGNPKILVSNHGKSIKHDETQSAEPLDRPKAKQEEEKIPEKPKETLSVDASSEKSNKTAEAKSKSQERVKEEADLKVKEEIMQKLKDELSSKLKNEWKVKLFDELADRIKPVIELKLTSDKPKNQIYLEKAKSEKLEAQREQPQVKDQLKEELKELKEELKKIKMKEELKQELKSELKGEFTSRIAAEAQAFNLEPVRLKSEKVSEGTKREDIPRKTESVRMTDDQNISTAKDEQLEKYKKPDECYYNQNSVPVMPGWYGNQFGSSALQHAEQKENLSGKTNVQNPTNFDMSESKQGAENDAENSPHHLPQREHPYLPRWDNPPGKDQPEKEPQRPLTQPNYKDHPYLPRWEPIPQRNPPSEPLQPQPQPPDQPYYPHTQPPHHPYQPQPQTPNQPYQPYQPQPQQPTQPSHPQPQIPNQPYRPQTQPPNQPTQPQTPNHAPYPSHRHSQEASEYKNEVTHPYWNQIISTPKEETNPFQDGHGERDSKEEAQPQKSWEPSSNPPQIDEARTQPSRSLDEEALSQSRQKYFKITLPETKMEEGKRTEDLKAKQKDEQDSAKKKEDEKIINQQSRAKFFRSLIPEKKNPKEKADEKTQKEENQGKKYFRTLLPDQRTPGKFMKFKGDQKKAKGTKKEESEKEKPNKTPGEIKLKELPPTKPEIKKSSDNKPAEILVKSIDTIVEQSRKSEMETAKQVEAAEQKKLIKHQQEAAVQKEPETKKQLEAVEQKELLRQQQEAAAKRDLEMKKHQEERDREYREAVEARRRDELAKKVPGIAGYGTLILEQQGMPVVRIPPDKKPDDSKDESSSEEKKIKFPGPETMTEKKSNPQEKQTANKEGPPAKSDGTSAEKLKSFMNPLKFGVVSTSGEKQSTEDDKKKPPSAEASTKKAVDKKETLSPVFEWEKKILGGSDKPKIDEGKKDKMSAKSDIGKVVHEKPKATEGNSKLADLGKRRSDLSDWEKEINEQTSTFFGGTPEPMKRDSDETKVKEEKKTKGHDLVPKKEESPPPDNKPKMFKEDDSEVLQTRVEHYLNIYDPPKTGGNDEGTGAPFTTTMNLPDIEQYDRSDLNDIFSAGLKTNDFNLYLSQEDADEILKCDQKTCQKEQEVSFVHLDQTNVSPSVEEMNLLTEPATAKSEVTLTPEQESSVHVVKLVIEDKKSKVGTGEENKRRSAEEANEELRPFVDLLRNVLTSKQWERVKIFLEKEANSKRKTDGERDGRSDLNLCMQLLNMAITNGKNEMLHNKSHPKVLTDSENNDVNLHPIVELLKRTVNNSQTSNGRFPHDAKQDWAENTEAEKEKNQLGSYLELFRKTFDTPGHNAKGKRTLQTGDGDVRRDAEADFRLFLQILKETIAKVDKQTQEAVALGELSSKKVQPDNVTSDLGVMNTTKKHTSVERVESAKRGTSSDQSEISAVRKESREGQTKMDDGGNAKKIGKGKTLDLDAHSEDSRDMTVGKKEVEKKTKESGEEGAEGSKKTIQVDKIIVNIKADTEEKEATEKRRKSGRKMVRKVGDAPDEEVAENQEKSTRKKKYRKKKFEEETMPRRKQEFLEEKRRRKLASASEEDSKKLTKTVPEKEPELEPGSNQMSEVAEETILVDYTAPQGDYSNRNSLEVKEVTPKPKKESFMGEKVTKEFTIREEPFDIEPVTEKSKAASSKRDVQSVESNIRAARVDKSYMKEGKTGKFLRTILPDSPNVEMARGSAAEEEGEQNDAGSTKLGKKILKSISGKEKSKMEEIQKVVKEEKTEEEPVKFGEGKRDSKGYVKSPKKNVSEITQKRDLQTLATAKLRNPDEKREPNRSLRRKLFGSQAEEDTPVGESVLGDNLRHRIASAPYRKTEVSYSEKEMSPIKDKTELKTVRVMEEAGEIGGGKRLIEAVAKKANEIPCAVAVDPENPSPLPPPVLAGAVLSARERKSKTKFWWQKIENGKK